MFKNTEYLLRKSIRFVFRCKDDLSSPTVLISYAFPVFVAFNDLNTLEFSLADIERTWNLLCRPINVDEEYDVHQPSEKMRVTVERRASKRLCCESIGEGSSSNGHQAT